MARSSAGAGSLRPRLPGSRARLRAVRADGTPVYRFDGVPGVPPVAVVRFGGTPHEDGELPEHRHAHDFHVLIYVEAGDGEAGGGEAGGGEAGGGEAGGGAGGDLRIDGVVQPLRAGEAITVPPGHVVGVGRHQPDGSRAWAVSFLPDAVPALAGVPPVAWAGHPLLAAFDDVRRVVVPPERGAAWVGLLAELHAETTDPSRPGADAAARAVLTRLLVDLARLAPAGAAGPGGGSGVADPLVQRVLAVVEARFAEPVSTGSVARELGYTAGHLTTVMRERTGRTVLDWLTERRMAEARRLLAETDLPLGVIAARTGFRDAAYLTRRFRAWHGTTPLAWRRGATSG
ncbi:helix-turn-helix transcriptional regulator [Xylanimonas protaetiae]|uniref:AraC family transcriptional regulator n=1 Tax=Xylanimonas protaetiae TaxID=2509457 RepID=A0A4P6F1F5_9MICO|nr:AraC family transcriptional regulator [Xylanimonas protaetiae]QAY69610.1 AraC family transcriptional regulator [Xylanimonas protaetiae]